MNRNRMEKNRKQFKDDKDDADEPPRDELAVDDQLVNSIRETYGNAGDETEYQLADWQARLR